MSADHPASDWRWQAVCASVEPKDIWYSTDLADMISARAICADCPVRRQCLTAGLHDEHGIWGGYTPTERHRLVRNMPASTTARDATMTRAAYVGPALMGVADPLHQLRTKEK